MSNWGEQHEIERGVESIGADAEILGANPLGARLPA